MNPTPWSRVIAASLLITAVIALLVTAFAWPSVRSEPNELPLVAAPVAAAQQVQQRLDAARPGAFEVTPVAGEAEARAALLDREAYGAVVLGPQGPTVLTASAASPVVAQLLGQVASAVAAGEQAPSATPGVAGAPTVAQDVVPLPDSDPRGAGLVAAALPLTLGGVLAAAALGHLVAGAGRRLVGVLLVAVLAGAAVAGILQTWLGALDGSFVEVAAVVGLALAASSTFVLGLGAVLGTVGTGLGAATLVLLGNPLSGAASAPEMLPAGWGALGQLLPPGAAVSALRSVAFFDGAAAAGPLGVLSGWLLLGLGLCAVGALRGRRRAAVLPVPPAPTAAARPCSVTV